MSITALLLNDNLTELPPEVVKALKIKPSSTLVFEIEADGRVLLSTAPTSKPKAHRTKPPAFAELTGITPKSPGSDKTGRMGQLLKAAASFPGLKPGVKPATIEELNEVIQQRAVARYERSLK